MVAGGCGTFYSISISHASFKGLSTIKQHRVVNELLKEEIKGMHGMQVSSSGSPRLVRDTNAACGTVEDDGGLNMELIALSIERDDEDALLVAPSAPWTSQRRLPPT